MNSPEFDIAAEIAKATQAYKAMNELEYCARCGSPGELQPVSQFHLYCKPCREETDEGHEHTMGHDPYGPLDGVEP